MAFADVAVRLLQYGALLALFGLTAFAAYAPGAARLRRSWGLSGLVLFSLTCSMASLPVLAARMTGALSEAFNFEVLWAVITATAAGAAWAVRVAALTLALLLPRLRLLLLAIALASLAWGGHAAAGEGAWGLMRLAADILHLLAAGVWIGALAAFVILAVSRPGAAAFGHALAEFGGIGSGVVAILIGTGLINTVAVGGWPPVESLTSSLWGRLLIVKLVLVAGMLALAARHRFILVPAWRAGERGRSLTLSLALEMALAMGVVVLVSSIGVLSPAQPGGG